jgi:glycosyltransferase involved in cell wall biosynthesis
MLISFPYFYYLVYQTYQNEFKGKIDLIIDETHGIPFLTPLYAKEKIVLYIHEVAGTIWDKMFPFPINSIGKFLEKLFLNSYKKVTTVTASKSTKLDLLNLGFNPKNIFIVEHGVSMKSLSSPKVKSNRFTILFLNRIVKMKGPERALSIFKKLKEEVKDAKMIMIGASEPDYLTEIKNKAKELGINKDIEFKGFVSEEEKIANLQSAHALINTSYKEGWGLVNLEANSQGTPAITFNVEGCKDSIKNGVNGFISETEEDFVKNILKIKENNLEQSSIDYANKFRWEEKAEEFYKLIEKEVNKK